MSEDDLNLIREIARLRLSCTLVQWKAALELGAFLYPDDSGELDAIRRDYPSAASLLARSSGQSPATIISAATGMSIDEAAKVHEEVMAAVSARKEAAGQAVLELAR